MWIIIVALLLWVYVWLQEAISNPIDKEIPFYRVSWRFPIADWFYRLVRCVGCIAIALMFQWGLPIWIGCYVFAWLFKKAIIYFGYKY